MSTPLVILEDAYETAVEWMFNQLPMFQNIGAAAYKNDLNNIILLCNHLGNPEKGLKCIHVAGTNGKGSTSNMLASVLQEAGYKVGLYTSPHLKDFKERIKVSGIDIDKKYVVDFVENNKSFFEENQLSFFEMTVGLAFKYFESQQTDINIIEVGMGGRLDATNIINPLISVITNIGLDHTQFLGNTIDSIAKEKAGIIKSEVPVVIGEYTSASKSVFNHFAKANNANIYLASDLIEQPLETILRGNYQASNVKTVMQTIDVLNNQKQFVVSKDALNSGLNNVLKNTNFQGRWQQLAEKPTIITDTGHNKHGLQLVITQILQQRYEKLHIVIGVVNDKDLTEILPLFPTTATYYFCAPNVSRGLPASQLKNVAQSFGLLGNDYKSVTLALDAAKKNAGINDFIFVGGSTFVVAEVV